MKRVLIVEPQSSGLQLIHAARRLGHEPIVLSYDRGDRKIAGEDRAAVAAWIIADTNDDEAALAAVEAYIAEYGPIDAVVPGFEYYVPLAALVGRMTECLALSAQAARAVRMKDVMRTLLAAAGLRVPRFAIATSPDALGRAAAKVELPAVVKPTNLSGSLQVRKVCTLPDLLDAANEIWQRGAVDLDQVASARLLVEEYIDGPEMSVEGYVEPKTGRIVHLSITKKLLGPEPYFVEMGHVVNSEPALGSRRDILAYVDDVVRALGIGVGAFHAELRVSRHDGKPYLMEVAARLAGDSICELIRLATGVDLAEATIRCFLGENMPLPLLEGAGSAGIAFFEAGASGTARDFSGRAGSRIVTGRNACEVEKKMEVTSWPASASTF